MYLVLCLWCLPSYRGCVWHCPLLKMVSDLLRSVWSCCLRTVKSVGTEYAQLLAGGIDPAKDWILNPQRTEGWDRSSKIGTKVHNNCLQQVYKYLKLERKRILENCEIGQNSPKNISLSRTYRQKQGMFLNLSAVKGNCQDRFFASVLVCAVWAVQRICNLTAAVKLRNPPLKGNSQVM